MHLKLVRDTLVNPARRFAYDRFGPDVVEWQNCVTIYDYISVGFQHIVPYYIASGLFMFVLGMLGYARRGSYVSLKYFRNVVYMAHIQIIKVALSHNLFCLHS